MLTAPRQESAASSSTKRAPATAKAKAEAGPAPGINGASSPGRQYWLMKAEPESRLEGSNDVKFSIDDLAARTEPEPWDGKRGPSAHLCELRGGRSVGLEN